jgi:hypothetical protein
MYDIFFCATAAISQRGYVCQHGWEGFWLHRLRLWHGKFYVFFSFWKLVPKAFATCLVCLYQLYNTELATFTMHWKLVSVWLATQALKLLQLVMSVSINFYQLYNTKLATFTMHWKLVCLTCNSDTEAFATCLVCHCQLYNTELAILAHSSFLPCLFDFCTDIISSVPRKFCIARWRWALVHNCSTHGW